MLKYLAMGMWVVGLSFAQAQQGLTAKERLEEAFKQFPTQGLNTVLVKRLYWSSTEMSPEVLTSKADFAAQSFFLSINHIGTQKRGVSFEELHNGKSGQMQECCTISGRLATVATDTNKRKSYDPFWLKNTAGLSKIAFKGNVTLEGTSFSIIEFLSKYGTGYVLLDDKNRFRGNAVYDSETKAFIDYRVCSTTTVEGYAWYELCHGYNSDLELIYGARLLDMQVNPKFTSKDWQLSKTLNTTSIDGSNPFGFTPIPADEFNLTGALVTPPVLRGAALKAGLSFGDQIIAINGKNVTKMVFSEAEAMFWGTKKLKLTIKTKKGATKTVTLVIK